MSLNAIVTPAALEPAMVTRCGNRPVAKVGLTLSCQAATVGVDELARASRPASFRMWRMRTLANCRLWQRRAWP